MNITIIYLEDEMHISKMEYGSWREIQDEYDNYMTSLGPRNSEEVVEYLNDEYSSLNPKAEIQVEKLFSSSKTSLRLTFND